MQKDLLFDPNFLIVPVGSSVNFPNEDDEFHNVFSYSKARRFDLGRYRNGESKTVEFDKVLMIGGADDVKIGTPVVAGAKVTAEVVTQGRHKKIKIVKFNRRKHYRKETGHRQWYTEVKITGISA